jgi:hypothetical protein
MSTVISIPGVKRSSFTVTLEGTSPLITQAVSKQTKDLLDLKARGLPIPPSTVRDPQQEFRDAIYRTKDGRPGIKAKAFKSACVTACTYIKEATKIATKGTFQILGDEILPIRGSDPVLRVDYPRPRGGSLVIAYRPEYAEWQVDLTILYNPSVMSKASILNLLEHAGTHVGVGCRRIETGDKFGAFQVKRDPTHAATKP